ncbi:MAG: hypothetical protein HQM01_11245 [Magnetococcales bacterium]|nr:hypothetical protein [Magnetococcales bacterium]
MVMLGLIVLAQGVWLPKGGRDAVQLGSSEPAQPLSTVTREEGRGPSAAEQKSAPGASVAQSEAEAPSKAEPSKAEEQNPTSTPKGAVERPPVVESPGQGGVSAPGVAVAEEKRSETNGAPEAPQVTPGGAMPVAAEFAEKNLQVPVQGDRVGDGPRVEPTPAREPVAMRGAPKQLKPKMKPQAKRLARKDGVRGGKRLASGMIPEDALLGAGVDGGIERSANPEGKMRQVEAAPSVPSRSASQARASSLFGMPPDSIKSGAEAASKGSGPKVEFVVAYGCFSNGGEIRRRQEAIRARGWPVRNSYYTVGQTIMTCLYSGPFPTPQAADKATDLFEEKGCLQLPKEEQPVPGP